MISIRGEGDVGDVVRLLCMSLLGMIRKLVNNNTVLFHGVWWASLTMSGTPN